MGTDRFRLNVEFEIYGEKFTLNASLNWSDRGEGIDHNIYNWFRNCHADAHNKYIQYEKVAAEEATKKISADRTKKEEKIEPTNNKLIDSREVMQRIGVSYTTLWRLVKAKKIPVPRKVGSLNRWLEADIEQYISSSSNGLGSQLTRIT